MHFTITLTEGHVALVAALVPLTIAGLRYTATAALWLAGRRKKTSPPKGEPTMNTGVGLKIVVLPGDQAASLYQHQGRNTDLFDNALCVFSVNDTRCCDHKTAKVYTRSEMTKLLSDMVTTCDVPPAAEKSAPTDLAVAAAPAAPPPPPLLFITRSDGTILDQRFATAEEAFARFQERLEHWQDHPNDLARPVDFWTVVELDRPDDTITGIDHILVSHSMRGLHKRAYTGHTHSDAYINWCRQHGFQPGGHEPQPTSAAAQPMEDKAVTAPPTPSKPTVIYCVWVETSENSTKVEYLQMVTTDLDQAFEKFEEIRTIVHGTDRAKRAFVAAYNSGGNSYTSLVEGTATAVHGPGRQYTTWLNSRPRPFEIQLQCAAATPATLPGHTYRERHEAITALGELIQKPPEELRKHLDALLHPASYKDSFLCVRDAEKGVIATIGLDV